MTEADAAWHVSFGVQYPREPHPTYPKADANGYVTILADTEQQARAKAYDLFDQHWSFLYEPGEEMSPDFWPMGELDRFPA